MSLKQKTISGLRWTTVSTVIVALLQVIQYSVLARFLAPSDFGLMAIATVIIGFSYSFVDMGFSNAIIHYKEITENQLSTIYWFNIITGAVLSLVIALLSPLIAYFYSDSRLQNIILLIGLTFIIQSFGQIYNTIWQKKLKFKELAKIEIINKVFAFIVSLIFAFLDYGVYSLVYATLTSSLLQSIQYFFQGRRDFKPKVVFNIKGIKQYINFGAFQMGERLINYFNYQIDSLLIGKLIGVEALGIYSMAKQLVMRPIQMLNPIITKVSFPAMAIIQEDINQLKNVYLKSIKILSSINFPIYGFLFVYAEPIVEILFGSQWKSATIVVQLLSIWAALRSTGNPVGSLLMARGKASLGFYWNLGMFFYTPVGVFIGSSWGLLGVCYSLIFLIFPLGLLANWYFLVKSTCGARFIEYHVNIFTPFCITLVTVFFAQLIGFWLNPIDKYLNMFVGGTLSAILALLIYYFTNRELFSLLREYVKKN